MSPHLLHSLPGCTQRIGRRDCTLRARETRVVRRAQVGPVGLGFPASLSGTERITWIARAGAILSFWQDASKKKQPSHAASRHGMVVMAQDASLLVSPPAWRALPLGAASSKILQRMQICKYASRRHQSLFRRCQLIRLHLAGERSGGQWPQCPSVVRSGPLRVPTSCHDTWVLP